MKMHLLFLLAALTFKSSPSVATSFNIRPMSEFTQTANNVVRGTVTNVHVENGITSDGGKTIYTYANVSVKETLKGNIHAANIVVRKLGGTKDGVTLEIPSQPEFVENDDTVLFLSAEQDDRSYEVVGMELGKFGLEEKRGDTYLTGGLLAYSVPQETTHPGEGEHSKSFSDIKENQHPWTLSQLRDLLKKQASNPASTPAAAATAAPSQATAVTIAATPKAETAASETKTETPENSSHSLYYWIGGLLILVVAFSVLKRK